MVNITKLQKEFEELANTTTSDISPIIKSEVFSRLIIEEGTKGRRLAGVIAASQEDIGKGDGDTVKVRIFPKIAVAQVAEGAANEAAAYKPFASSVTISRYSVTVPLTGESIYEASVDIQAKILSAIANGWADKMDEVITTTLDIGEATGTSYTPAAKEALTTAGDFSDFYAKLKALTDSMRYDLALNPDYLVIPKEIKAQLVADYEDATKKYAIEMDDNGELKSVYGLKVLVAPFATADDTVNQVVAVVVDKSVALGEATGMPAKFEEKREPEYDINKEVFNVYWGVNVIKADLDGDGTAEAIGVGQVVNPAA
ncbi:MAG: hypothetical protein H0Z33_16660 [Bacillaceae bacterium]|nr:hypothetical protein [Bacillaceae bacterium]